MLCYMHLGIGKLGRHTTIEVRQLLKLMASEDKYFVLEKRREPAIITNSEILGLSPDLTHNAGIEPRDRLLEKEMVAC